MLIVLIEGTRFFQVRDISLRSLLFSLLEVLHLIIASCNWALNSQASKTMLTYGDVRALIASLESRCSQRFRDDEPFQPDYTLDSGDGRV